MASTDSLHKRIADLHNRIADQIETSEERCVAAEESGQQAAFYIFTSREAIRRSRDQLARIAAIESLPVSICSGRGPVKAATT